MIQVWTFQSHTIWQGYSFKGLTLIKSICTDYKLTKGMTEFYITPMMEQRGDGGGDPPRSDGSVERGK